MNPTEPDTNQPPALGRGARLKAAVTEAHVVLDLLLAPAIKELGLTIGEADVLTVLSLNPDPLLPGEIAAQLNITGPGATGRLNGLERRGYIKRLPNPEDGRSVTVHLTESGEALARAVIEKKNATIDNALVDEIGDATADDLTEQLESLIALIVSNLDEAAASDR